MSVKTRFAPSPTGRLHVGNARMALINWLFAKKKGGALLLRLDDTDEERSTNAYAEGIKEDLTWLGLEWDEFARQSDRYDRYDAAIETLKADGRLYACYETPEELERKRKLQLASNKPPVYDRSGLNLTENEKKDLEDQGRLPHWRFLLEPEEVAWSDGVRGDVHFDAASLSDPVLVREDGRPLYTLSSMVDDLELGVSDILRGEDHVANTAAQIQLFRALGGAAPNFAHFALLTGAEGESLSKRFGSLSIEALRDDGFEPMALNSLLARLGTSDPVVATSSIDDLIEHFDIARFGRAAAKFDVRELEHVNARIVHQLDFDDVAGELADTGVNEKVWNAVRANLTFAREAADWCPVIDGPIAPVIEDQEVLDAAAQLLPEEPWDEETWGAWTAAIAEETGKKGRALFHPLRLAITGRERGPEMKTLLPLIGRKRVLARLHGESA